MTTGRTSHTIRALLLGALVSWVALPGSDARAQNVAIEPAETIRVVERADRWSREVRREVVEELLPAEVLAIQVELAEAGFDPGVRNGLLGPATRSALRSFQVDRGLSTCGCVSYETVVALGIVPDVVGSGSAYARRGHDQRVIVVVPDRRHRRSHRSGAAVVVGAGGRTGVYAGHAPAVGARRAGHADRRPPRPDPDRVSRPSTSRPRPGERIRGGGSDAFQGRPPSERPRRPDPR